ncbi:MAG: DUF2292 domain-containing protein [Negativicutes bacterium]|nr:DUF2292 domain-containing protein [Negativicutes bacterium]
MGSAYFDRQFGDKEGDGFVPNGEKRVEKPVVNRKAGTIVVKDVAEQIREKLRLLRWGKIEIIVRDARVTQINTMEEERL